MIKLVATDIDGTILPYNSDFTKEVKTCIKNLEEKGVKVILVTGRMHSSTVPISDILELKNPIISYQGGLIKDYDGKTIYQAQLNPETAKEVMEAMDSRNTTTNYSEAIESNAPNGIAELENNENVRVIILGFNGLNKTGDIPYFDMHFTTLNEKFISSFMKIPFNIKHKNNLRNLQNVNNTQSPSGIDYSNSTNWAYHINVKNRTENITEIEIIIDLSKNYTNRINILNNFENDTSIITCEFNTTKDNYNLKCDSNLTVNAISDSSFMIIIDNIKDKKIIIIIKFIDSNETDTPTGTDSQIESYTSESGYRRYNKARNGKNIAGLIVLLVVILILAVSATIVAMVSLKKKKTIPAENTVQDATVSSWI